MTAIGVVHPGEMGAALSAALAGTGARVAWASEGRSEATRARAAVAGLDDLGTIGALARECAVVLSVCPPHAARDVARAIAATGFRGRYVDANAVSPATATDVAAIVTAAGATYVDGGIVGPPPRAAGDARLFLAGRHAGQIAALFDGTVVAALAISEEPTAASALKMAYAAWTKGSAALLLAARAAARELGVEDELLAEWERSQPALPERWEAAARAAEAKGWRWTGEMEEIADTFAAVGLPDGFHRAAAGVFARRPPLTS